MYHYYYNLFDAYFYIVLWQMCQHDMFNANKSIIIYLKNDGSMCPRVGYILLQGLWYVSSLLRYNIEWVSKKIFSKKLYN